MRRHRSRLPVLLLALAACQRAPDGIAVDGIAVDRAWVRLPAVAGGAAAGYFRVTGGPAPDRLLGVASPAAPRVELHASGMHAGMMTMTPLAGVDIPAHGTVALAPGATHAMIFGLPPAARAGTPVPLTLRFRSGATLTVTARTVAAGDDAAF